MEVDPDLVERLREPVAIALRETLGSVVYAREVSRHPVALDLTLITHPIEDGEGVKIDAVVGTEKDEASLATTVPLVETLADLRRLVGLQDLWPISFSR